MTTKKESNANPLEAAIASEQKIADEAATIRADHGETRGTMDAELFCKLAPLLRRPIPPGFITTTGRVKGKPYESTGVRSVQVCIDRMDNVLTPLAWSMTDDYENDGKLCRVTIAVRGANGTVLVARSSYGGVEQASTAGNLRKGSFTNAAKRAFGMIGVGHEIYLGAADGDPDTDEDAAKAQGERRERGRAERTAPAPTPAPATPVVPPDDALAELIASDQTLRGLRTKADDGMKILGAKAGQRLRELKSARTESDLVALVNRIENSLEVGPDDPPAPASPEAAA